MRRFRANIHLPVARESRWIKDGRVYVFSLTSHATEPSVLALTSRDYWSETNAEHPPNKVYYTAYCIRPEPRGGARPGSCRAGISTRERNDW